MQAIPVRKFSQPFQYLSGVLLVILIAAICFVAKEYINYHVVAFILLVTVSIAAVLLDIRPVLLVAAMSALIWDYFFIPPRFTLQVGSTEDRILLLMYFVIASVNAVLTYKIRRAEKIARMKEERIATVKLYNTFLNSLSHELRTPIAAIIGATDNLLEGNHHLSVLHKADLLGEIRKAAFRLNQQVKNLLNVSRLESGFIQPKKDWCDVIELVYEVVHRVEENKITQKISVDINPSIPLFRIDKGMMEQVLYNLLYNATLYTPPESRIEITALAHADVLEVIVEDNGPGFPSEETSAVFDKFYRLKHSKAGGTGLGLSIVKGFTEAMGGTVQLSTIQNNGARFSVQLPGETSYLKNLKNE
jgi:two-component system sensor histidine kinase KdpD